VGHSAATLRESKSVVPARFNFRNMRGTPAGACLAIKEDHATNKDCKTEPLLYSRCPGQKWQKGIMIKEITGLTIEEDNL
jgi:hypothetical protein